MVLWVFNRCFRVGNFGEIHVGLVVCFVFLFLLPLIFALFGCFLGGYTGFLLSSNMFLYICVSVYYRLLVILKAVLYFLVFNG